MSVEPRIAPAAPAPPLWRRVLATVPVLAIYGVLRALMWVGPRLTPERRGRMRQEARARPRSAPAIRLAVALYRTSLIHDYAHRGGERCVFLPSCSDYADRVGRTYALVPGLVLVADRFRRCRADTAEDPLDFP